MERSCKDCRWCVDAETKSGALVALRVNDVDGDYMAEVGYLSGADCEGFAYVYSFERGD